MQSEIAASIVVPNRSAAVLLLLDHEKYYSLLVVLLIDLSLLVDRERRVASVGELFFLKQPIPKLFFSSHVFAPSKVERFDIRTDLSLGSS